MARDLNYDNGLAIHVYVIHHRMERGTAPIVRNAGDLLRHMIWVAHADHPTVIGDADQQPTAVSIGKSNHLIGHVTALRHILFELDRRILATSDRLQ